MATGTQPDAGQILNSLINSILLIDDKRRSITPTPPRNNCSPKAPANCLVRRYRNC